MSDALDGQPSLNATRHVAGQETLAAPAQGDTVTITDELSKRLIASGIQQLAAPGKANDLLRLCRDVLASLQPILLTKADLTTIILDTRASALEPTAFQFAAPSAAPKAKTYASLLHGQSKSTIIPPPARDLNAPP